MYICGFLDKIMIKMPDFVKYRLVDYKGKEKITRMIIKDFL